jgi:hypothetical protein
VDNPAGGAPKVGVAVVVGPGIDDVGAADPPPDELHPAIATANAAVNATAVKDDFERVERTR